MFVVPHEKGYVTCFGELCDDSNFYVTCYDEWQDDYWCDGNISTKKPFASWQEVVTELSNVFTSGIIEITAV